VAVSRRAALLPLFLVSAGSVGFEIALTRYFAVAKWSEYGYWVISIVMAGFALSGVAVTLFRDSFKRSGGWLLALLPALITAAAALGYRYTVANPFNPLQLQNAATWLDQVGNIGLYYAALTPFFFLAGLFVSLSFVLNAGEIGRVYGYDLVGAGFGAALVLGLMAWLHPFDLEPALLAVLAAAALFTPGRLRWAAVPLALISLVGGEYLLREGPQPGFNDFKAIYAPLHTPNAKVAAEVRSPRGDYLLLDDFTERVDTDVSNNTGLLKVESPPRTLGLYRDGTRIAALPRPGGLEARYAPAALAAAPYALMARPRVLLEGASGGFRIVEALGLGAARVDALEPEPVLRSALLHGLGPSPALAQDPRVRILDAGPLAAARSAEPGAYDLIDLSPDFLDSGEANGAAFTTEAVAADLKALSKDGVLSIPVSIRDFPVYALRVLATVRQGLIEAGVADPGSRVVVYRSAWSVRVLISRSPWDKARIDRIKAFADDRSFDLSFYPGFDAKAARESLYNDLPSVDFRTGEITARGPDDAIADEASAVLAGRPTASQAAFSLTPITLDRPAFYAVLDLRRLDTLIKRLEVLPQGEIGALVNLAVLAQAALIALIVLAVPLIVRRRLKAEAPTGGLGRIVYFSALGLGFLFVEIFLIEKAAVFLNDRTTAFALVLTGMLVFSGAGAMLAGRIGAAPRLWVGLAALVMLGLGLAVFRVGEQTLLDHLTLAWNVRAALVLGLAAAVSLMLGLPFPLGLRQVGDGRFLPWAWALNGAFSVVATPLANLIAREAGFSWLLYAAGGLYLLAFIAFPGRSLSTSWNETSKASAAAA
jgi:hypothetical protein